MVEVQKSKPHELRTASEPRQSSLYQLRVSHISQVNQTIRLIRFNVVSGCDSLDWSRDNSESFSNKQYSPLRFLPGQWLDVHIPNIKHAGGFTITSTPQDATPRLTTNTTVDGNEKPSPYIELAVQYSPTNPAAKWFWQPVENILNTHVKVRVGGGFVWPPRNGMSMDEIKNIIFVAGGVGINPLISMISYIHHTRPDLPPSSTVHLLYSTRVPLQSRSTPSIPTYMEISSKSGNSLSAGPVSQILFLDRLQGLVRNWNEVDGNINPLDLQLFITNLPSESREGCKLNHRSNILDMDNRIFVHDRRIKIEDLRSVIGENEEIRSGTVCYICGPPVMTDDFVEELQNILGGESLEGKKRVFYEKWW